MPKILIAEDDLMIAEIAEMVLVDAGYDVCGIARTVDEAVSLCRIHNPDLALIDLRLDNGDDGARIAAELGERRRLGILYASGNSMRGLTAEDGNASLTKPYLIPELLRGLEIVAELVATGTASPPFPRGFHLLPPANATPPMRSYG